VPNSTASVHGNVAVAKSLMALFSFWYFHPLAKVDCPNPCSLLWFGLSEVVFFDIVDISNEFQSCFFPEGQLVRGETACTESILDERTTE